MTSTDEPTLADFVTSRIRELADERGYLQQGIARAAGMKPRMLQMIADGAAKLPLDQVRELASALGCGASELMRLALPQYLDRDVLALVYESANAAPQDELRRLHAWIVALEVATGPIRNRLSDLKAANQELTETITDFSSAFDEHRAELSRLSEQLTEKLPAS